MGVERTLPGSFRLADTGESERRRERHERLFSRWAHAFGSEMSRLMVFGGNFIPAGGVHRIAFIVCPMWVMFSMSWL